MLFSLQGVIVILIKKHKRSIVLLIVKPAVAIKQNTTEQFIIMTLQLLQNFDTFGK